MKKVDNKNWIWDRYWQFDRVASCFDTEKSNYPVEFKADWDGFFTCLPGGTKILDLCTGNGAIARMAAEFSHTHSKKFEVTAIDRAAIDPQKFVSKTPGDELIDFQGGIDAGALPFPDASFDALISQYGFEYTDQAKTLAEAARILKSGAPVKLICHAAEGTPAASARAEVAAITFVTKDLDLFNKARAATEAALSGDKTNSDKINPFEKALARLSAALQKDPDNTFFASAHGLMKHTFEVRDHFPLKTLLEKIDDTELEALAHQGRIEALLAASLSEADCRVLLESLGEQGFGGGDFKPFVLDDGARLVGWRLQFHRLA